MNRLDKIGSYIEPIEKVIDVGCDQALLSKKLAKKGIYSIASDLRENIINDAFNSTKEDLRKFIDFRVGDGVTLKIGEEDYTLVLAGMGTHTILNIFKNCKFTFNKIITISNNNHDILRREMVTFGYKVLLEEIIKEKGKYYNLIIFTKGYMEYSKEELIVGVNHQNKILLKERNEYLINKYKRVLKQINNDDNKNKLEDIVNILNNYKY